MVERRSRNDCWTCRYWICCSGIHTIYWTTCEHEVRCNCIQMVVEKDVDLLTLSSIGRPMPVGGPSRFKGFQSASLPKFELDKCWRYFPWMNCLITYLLIPFRPVERLILMKDEVRFLVVCFVTGFYSFVAIWGRKYVIINIERKVYNKIRRFNSCKYELVFISLSS